MVLIEEDAVEYIVSKTLAISFGTQSVNERTLSVCLSFGDYPIQNICLFMLKTV